MTPLSPVDVLRQVSQALPADCLHKVIVIGSLAAGYHFFAGEGQRAIRTKDVDCMFSPHAKAVSTAAAVAERLLAEGWRQRTEGDWSQPGTAGSPVDQLPLVRLKPPGERGGADWFIELLGAPDRHDLAAPAKVFRRVPTPAGHYAICSFRFLALAEWQPIETPLGICIARPETMALANLLHHPRVGPDLIAGTGVYRSHKDLGRVLALAWLANRHDRIHDTETFEAWAPNMGAALKSTFGDQAPALARQAGAGLRELMREPEHLEQALRTCNLGLLSSLNVDVSAFAAMGRRVIQEVIVPLEEHAAAW